jgi:hypothetical protein
LKHIRFLQNDDAVVAKKRLFGFFLRKPKINGSKFLKKNKKKRKKFLDEEHLFNLPVKNLKGI